MDSKRATALWEKWQLESLLFWECHGHSEIYLDAYSFYRDWRLLSRDVTKTLKLKLVA